MKLTMHTATSEAKSPKLAIIGYVFFTFLGYLCIGLPLAVIPMFVHNTLGYTEIIAGVVISLQYLATFMIRGYSGKIVDTQGPKRAVLLSMGSFVVSGLLLFLALYLRYNPLLSISVLALSRLLTGCAEGMIGASPINWAMMVIGREHTATAISYNGIASYGALALGAPIGVWIASSMDIAYIGLVSALIGAAGYTLAKTKVAVHPPQGSTKQISFWKVLGIVAPFGAALGLAGIGFGGISNFITLYYDHFQWSHAAYCLSAFSVLFVLGRFIFADAIGRFGGKNVALICLIVEVLGLLLLFSADQPLIALLGAAVTGIGFSLVFPALGVEAVKRAPIASSGAALAAYGLFIDISLGVTGPFAGTVIKLFGMPYLFAFCALMVFIGLLIVWRLRKQSSSKAEVEKA